MKTVLAQTVGGELVERRHLARPAKGTRLSETDVVEENDDNIRISLRRVNLKVWRRFCGTRIQLRDSRWLRLCHG